MDILGFRRPAFLFPLLFLFLLIESQTAFAHHECGNKWLVGLGGGAAWPTHSFSNSTSISNGAAAPAPYNVDVFSISAPSVIGFFTALGGYQWHNEGNFLPYYSLLLHYEHQFDANISGTIQQYGLPQFRNYNYAMALSTDIVNVMGKVDLMQYEMLLPYVSVGLGAAFNRVSGYSESPIPSVNPARISPAYNSKTKTNFAYALGAGIDVILNQHWWMTVGYEYLHLGTVNSNSGSGTWSNGSLNFGTFATNTAFVSVNYLFNMADFK